MRETVLIQLQNRLVQVALSVWQRVSGGYTSADAPNAGTSAAVIPRQTNMPQSTTRLQAILLSQASSAERIGSTTTAQRSSLQGLSYSVLTLTPWISPYLDRPDGCPQSGSHSFTNKVRVASKWSLTLCTRGSPYFFVGCRRRRISGIDPSCNTISLQLTLAH